jgi:hypothetical protein
MTKTMWLATAEPDALLRDLDMSRPITDESRAAAREIAARMNARVAEDLKAYVRTKRCCRCGCHR